MKRQSFFINKNKKNFNIVYVIPRPDGGGAEFLVRELAYSLNKKGFNVMTIYFYNPLNIKLKSYEYCLNLKNYRDFRAIWYLRKKLFDLNKKRKTIVHAHLTWPLYFVSLATIGIKTINFYTEHNTYNRRRKFSFLKPIENYIYSRYSKIICISNGTKKKLLMWLDNTSNSKKTIVVPNGSRLFNFIKRKKINSKKINLVSIGSLSNQKGFDIAIKAIFLIKDRVKKYTIIGEGEQKKKLLALAIKLGVKDKISFTGYIDNLKSYLSKADIGLVTSRWEGFGLVSVEMLSTGMPLICSNVIGLKEVVSQCKAVKLVQAENPKALAKGILKLVNCLENSNANKIAIHAKKHADKYNISLFCRKYTDLYLKAVSKCS